MYFDWRNIGNMSCQDLETQQAIVVLKLFGGGNVNAGVKRVAQLLRKDASTIHRWRYPRSRGGTGGYIPTSSLTDLLFVARLEGILIRPEQLYPEFNI